jgi:hypothetical protein
MTTMQYFEVMSDKLHVDGIRNSGSFAQNLNTELISCLFTFLLV